jgi:phosphohistidine phosphatase
MVRSRHAPFKDAGMKTLHLLRHAKAEARAEDPPAGREDHARPLAKRGHKAAAALAEHLADDGFKVDRVFCSTAVRARETLEPLRPLLSGTPIAFRETLYMIEPDTLVEFLRSLPDSIGSVLVVGHNPTFHDIALTLTDKAAKGEGDALKALKMKFPTGALCSIACDVSRWSALGPKCGTLTQFLRPRDLD